MFLLGPSVLYPGVGILLHDLSHHFNITVTIIVTGARSAVAGKKLQFDHTAGSDRIRSDLIALQRSLPSTGCFQRMIDHRQRSAHIVSPAGSACAAIADSIGSAPYPTHLEVAHGHTKMRPCNDIWSFRVWWVNLKCQLPWLHGGFPRPDLPLPRLMRYDRRMSDSPPGLTRSVSLTEGSSRSEHSKAGGWLQHSGGWWEFLFL